MNTLSSTLRITLHILIPLCLANGIHGQTAISGTVKDREGRALAGVSIWIKGSFDGTSSDSSGNFSLQTALTGEYSLCYSSLHFEEDSTVIKLDGSPITLALRLTPKVNEIDMVTISVGTFHSGATRKGISLSALDIATTAGAEADLFSAYQTLPGVQTAFAEGGLFVRGGSAAETNMFFDGLIVKQPINAQAPNIAGRSRLDPFMFKQTAFSSGGYSAQYGQALSSALILESKDLPSKTTTSVSLMSVGLGLGQILRFPNSSLQLDGFYYNLNPLFSLVKQQADWQQAPVQSEGRMQYKAKIGKHGMLKWYADHSRSRMALHDVDLNQPEIPAYFSNRNSSTLINTSYQDNLRESWKINTGVTYNRTKDRGLMDVSQYERADSYWQWRGTITYYHNTYSKTLVGGETTYGSYQESLDALSRGYHHRWGAIFAETDWFFGPKWVLRTGLRGEYSNYIQRFNLAPRLALSHKMGKHVQASLAYGRFYQNPEDRYWVVQQDIDFEHASHYIVNIEYVADDYTLRIEAYHKDYSNLVRESAEGFSNNGFGYAKGVDVFWRDRKSIKNADYWISYSFLDTERYYEDYPAAATPPFAAKHSFNAVYKHFVYPINSQIGATYTYASGRPYMNPNNPVFMSDRTRDFHNLSMSVSYLTQLFRQFTVVFVSASNLLGTDNVFGYRYSTDGMTRRAIRPGAKREFFIGILMTIGDNTFIR